MTWRDCSIRRGQTPRSQRLSQYGEGEEQGQGAIYPQSQPSVTFIHHVAYMYITLRSLQCNFSRTNYKFNVIIYSALDVAASVTNFTLTFEWSRSKFKVTPILFHSLRIAAYGKEKDDPIIHVPYQSPIQGQALVFPPLPFPPFPLPDPILCLSLSPHFRPSLPNTLSLSPVFCPAWPRSIYPPIQLGRLGVMTSI